MDTTEHCPRCKSYAWELHDLERRAARMAEALEAVKEHIAPVIESLPPERAADKALAKMEAALRLWDTKGGGFTP